MPQWLANVAPDVEPEVDVESGIGVGAGVHCAGGVMVIVTHFSLSITMVPVDSLLERNPPKKTYIGLGIGWSYG